MVTAHEVVAIVVVAREALLAVDLVHVDVVGIRAFVI